MEQTGQPKGWILSARAQSTVLSPDRTTVYSFDLEGRPLSWFTNGRVYKRSLASDVHVRERVGGARRHWKLDPAEASDAFARVLNGVSRAPVGEAHARMRERLDEILRWDPRALLRERERFDAAYVPVNILPPDQYLAIVLQATFGCSWNRCSFCGFYADQPFRARDPDEFRAHCETVRDLLGSAEGLRRRIFLGAGNALMLADRRLTPLIRTAREFFRGRPISAFVDVFGGERKGVDDWARLREEGLERVHVGLETGDEALLRWLNKPGGREESREFVSVLKRAGVAVAAILMVGVGGKRYAAEHVRETLSLLGRLPLGRGDTVYLSPFLEQADSAYAHRASAEGVLPLNAAELDRQYTALRDGIRRVRPRVTVARYDIREFVY